MIGIDQEKNKIREGKMHKKGEKKKKKQEEE